MRIKQKVVVTGGCGFIGSHLVEKLIENNYDVVVIDDLSTGKLENINNFKNIDLKIFKVEEYNFSKLKNIKAVFHLAAQTSVPYSIDNFYKSTRTNLLSTLKVIDFCVKKTIPFIYASSSAIYGNLKFGDEYKSIDLMSPYAVDKYVTEIYASTINKLYKIPSFGLRFFNVYGPRQDSNNPYSGVISIFIDRLIKKKSITINGGNQTRDFIHVNDIVNCIISSYNKLLNNNSAYYCNILTGKSISINELAYEIAYNLKINPEIHYKELSKNDPMYSNGSIVKMNKILNVNPVNFIDIKNGLKETIDWYKTYLKI